MAWLSGITGKAENFLNSLDQKAATALKENETSQSPSVSAESFTSTKPTLSDIHKGQSGLSTQTSGKKTLGHVSQTVPTRLSEVGDNWHETASLAPKTKVDQTKKKVDTDEALFEFLNSPEPADRRKSTPVNSTRHS